MPINDYVTLAEMKAAMPDLAATLSSGQFDDFLTFCITNASRAIDLYTYRQPGAFYVTDDTTQWFQPYGRCQPRVFILDIAGEPTSVSVTQDGNPANYLSWPTTNYWMYPYNALANGNPYYAIEVNAVTGTYQTWPYFPRSVQIVGPFGYSLTPPGPVKEVTVIQAGRWFKRGQLAYQDKVAYTDKMVTFAYMNAIDRDLENIVSYLRRSRLSTTAGG